MLIDILASFRDRRVLVIGDVMLDRYVEGRASRISPEAPVPVLNVEREDSMPGGAANVAANIAALGGRAVLLGVVGADPAGYQLEAMMRRYTRIETHVVRDPERATTVKTRFIAGQHMLRADGETAEPVTHKTARKIKNAMSDAVGKYAAVIMSDYGKGVLMGERAQEYWPFKTLGIPVVVDPKGLDFGRYTGADLITPNAAELSAATGMPTETVDQIAYGDPKWPSHYDLVTRGALGMVLVNRRTGEFIEIPAHKPRALHDITGAGDTVVAVMGLAAAAGAPWEDAARLANVAASIAVSKPGTATVSPSEIEAELLDMPQISDGADAALMGKVAGWRRQGLRIGFANGCFDLLHGGHIHLLTEARKRCDRLIVAINSDDSVWRLKGEDRPIEPQQDRARKVLPYADAVCIFGEDTPAKVLMAVMGESAQPIIRFLGAEYTDKELAEVKVSPCLGGSKVVFIPMLEDRSTTGITQKIRDHA